MLLLWWILVISIVYHRGSISISMVSVFFYAFKIFGENGLESPMGNKWVTGWHLPSSWARYRTIKNCPILSLQKIVFHGGMLYY